MLGNGSADPVQSGAATHGVVATESSWEIPAVSAEQPDVSSYHDQWALFRGNGYAAPDSWRTHTLESWSLVAHPSLPVQGIRTKDGSHVGWMLGHAVAPAGRLVRDGVPLDCDTPADVSDAVIEAAIYRHGGRFAAVIARGQVGRVYLDPYGSLAAVFSPRHRCAASTNSVVYAVSGAQPPERLGPGRFPDQRPMQYWVAGLTGDAHVRRLLPNHYLDLAGWQSVRHRPQKGAGVVRRAHIDDSIEPIIRHVRNCLNALMEDGPAYLGLTAGRDTRMILACLPPEHRQRVELITFDYNDGAWGTRADVYVSQRVALQVGLAHRVMRVEESSSAVKENYLRQIGWAGGSGKARDFRRAAMSLDSNRAWVTGFGGLAFWRYGPADGRGLPTLEELLQPTGHPLDDEFRAAVKRWMDELGTDDPDVMTDCWHIENRVGSWVGPHLYGMASFAANVIPFSHREIVEAAHQVPLEYRRPRKQRRVEEAVVRAALPALAEIPYADYSGPRRVYERARLRLRRFLR